MCLGKARRRSHHFSFSASRRFDYDELSATGLPGFCIVAGRAASPDERRRRTSGVAGTAALVGRRPRAELSDPRFAARDTAQDSWKQVSRRRGRGPERLLLLATRTSVVRTGPTPAFVLARVFTAVGGGVAAASESSAPRFVPGLELAAPRRNGEWRSGGRSLRLGGCYLRSGARSQRASHWNQRMPIPANTTM